MFVELDGYTRYEDACEIWFLYRRKSAVARTAAWRIANPAKFKAQRRRSKYNYSKRYPAKNKAAKKRYRDTHREEMRAIWRRNSAAYRMRQAQAQAQEQAQAQGIK